MKHENSTKPDLEKLPAKKVQEDHETPCIYGGVVLGVLLGWVTRPSLFLGVKITLSDYFSVLNEMSKDTRDAQVIHNITIHLIICGIIGAAAGVVLNKVLRKLNAKS